MHTGLNINRIKISMLIDESFKENFLTFISLIYFVRKYSINWLYSMNEIQQRLLSFYTIINRETAKWSFVLFTTFYKTFRMTLQSALTSIFIYKYSGINNIIA